MAAPDATTLTKLYAGTATGPNTQVNLLNTLDVTETSEMVEVTDFGDTYVSRLQAIQKATFSGSGFLDLYNDTTGQRHLMANALEGTTLWFKLRYGSSADDYFINTLVGITEFTIKTNPHGMIEFSFSANSSGTITHGAD